MRLQFNASDVESIRDIILQKKVSGIGECQKLNRSYFPSTQFATENESRNTN
jgi:hypothetical protein